MDLQESWRIGRAVVRELRVRRRLAVAILVGFAAVSALSALRPSPVATVAIWVAAHDLTGGEPLTAGDLAVERLPKADVPAAVLAPGTRVVGRLLAAPMSRGEPLTGVRVLSTALLDATDVPGDVAVPVRVADGPATAALVRAGDHVDVIAAADPAGGGPTVATTVAADLRVLVTPNRDSEASDAGDSGALVIVAATPKQATSLADAAGSARLSVAVRQPP
jgi:pilus assembly protein CpaB